MSSQSVVIFSDLLDTLRLLRTIAKVSALVWKERHTCKNVWIVVEIGASLFIPVFNPVWIPGKNEGLNCLGLSALQLCTDSTRVTDYPTQPPSSPSQRHYRRCPGLVLENAEGHLKNSYSFCWMSALMNMLCPLLLALVEISHVILFLFQY